MLNDQDRVSILEMWSQFRPNGTEEDAYPQILTLIESAIVLKLSAPRQNVVPDTPVNRVALAGGRNGG